MRITLALLMILAMFGCKTESSENNVNFSGVIENPNRTGIRISDFDYEKEIPLDENGAFTVELENIQEGIYTLWDSVESTKVYFIPGQDLHLTMNTEEFDESIVYSGTDSRGSNYLATKFLYEESRDLDYKSLFSLDEPEFLTQISQIENGNLDLLKSVDSLPEKLVELEKQNFNFEKLTMISNYQGAHAFYTKNTDFKPSENFLQALQDIDFTDEELYKQLESYRRLVIGHYTGGSIDENLAKLDEIKSSLIKKDVLQDLIYAMRPGSSDLDKIYEGLSAHTDDEAFKADLVSKYELYKDLAAGKPSPLFNYPDINGEMVSLTHLKGKLVYIDVWATWCGPCLGEIPSLKELVAEYHDKNIAFVSLSIDRIDDKAKWEKMVADRELKGIQLFADKDWSSEFVQAYGIRGIPRFILVDQEGMIISADAPRPSSGEKIRELISTNL